MWESQSEQLAYPLSFLYQRSQISPISAYIPSDHFPSLSPLFSPRNMSKASTDQKTRAFVTEYLFTVSEMKKCIEFSVVKCKIPRNAEQKPKFPT